MAFEIKVVRGNHTAMYHPTHISIKDVWPNSPAGRWYLAMLDMSKEQVEQKIEEGEIGEVPGTYIELCGLDRRLFPKGSIVVHMPGDNPDCVPADAVFSLNPMTGDTKDRWPSSAMRAQLEMVKAGWRPDKGEPMPEVPEAETQETEAVAG